MKQPRSQGPLSFSLDPSCSWSHDCSQETPPQSGCTRSILFARAEQIFSSGHKVKRTATDLAQFHASKFRTVKEAEVNNLFYNLNRSNLSTVGGTVSIYSTRKMTYSSLNYNKYFFCCIK